MARVLGLDYGDRRIGVAVADTEVRVATGLDTVTWAGKRDLREQVGALVAEYDPERFVVGLPLEMDGGRGERCEAVGSFTARLQGWTGLPVELQDERLTSAAAERSRMESGTSEARARSKGMIDRAAAILILQSWLDLRSNAQAPDQADDQKAER